MKFAFIKNLQRIWNSQGATLNEDTQSAIKNILFGEPIVQKTFELIKEEDSSGVRQLATALISSWEARNDGDRALDAFNLLSSIAEKFFNLKLGGDVGAIVNSNKVAHEALDGIVLPDNIKVQIIRPWVEWETLLGILGAIIKSGRWVRIYKK